MVTSEQLQRASAAPQRLVPALPLHQKFARPKPAAQHFGIGVSTYWHWVKNRPGFPQPIKAGPAVTLVDIGATEAYLRAQSDIEAQA